MSRRSNVLPVGRLAVRHRACPSATVCGGCSNLAGAVTVSPSNSSLEHDPAPSTASPSISEPLPTVGGGSHHARDAREMLRERRLVTTLARADPPMRLRKPAHSEPGSLRALEQRARMRGRPTSSPGGPRPVRVWRMPTMVSFTHVAPRSSQRAVGRTGGLERYKAVNTEREGFEPSYREIPITVFETGPRSRKRPWLLGISPRERKR